MTKSDEFKREAVHGLRCINEKEFYYTVDGVYVKSVRAFVSLLGISSSTLYRWDASWGHIDLEPAMHMPIQEETFEEFEEGIKKDFDDALDLIVKEPFVETIFEEMVKDVGFWQSLARALKMPNYRQTTNQLKLRIGNELIKSTGLVINGVREELRLNGL